MIRTNSPVAVRIPLLTAAPLPLLYGWRMTRAPALSARVAVSSLDPSSTTTSSFQAAAARNDVTSAAIDAASLKAGMTIDVRAARSDIGHQSSTVLCCEAEVDDVAVLDDVVLTFEADFAVIPADRHRSARDQRVVAHDLRTDEAA